MDEILDEAATSGPDYDAFDGEEAPARRRPARAPSRRLSKRARGILIVLVILAAAAFPGYKVASSILDRKPAAQRAAEAVVDGLAAHRAGRLDAATARYLEAIRLDPQNTLAHYNLGLVAQTSGDTVTAEREYRITLAINPNFPPAAFNLAIIRTDAGSLAEAEELYRKVIRLEPKNAAAHLNLGFLLVKLGRKTEAEAAFSTAIRLDPSLASRIPKTASPTPRP